MKLKIDFSAPNIPLEFDYSSQIISLGSCFSDEISCKLRFAGFNVLDNPFGVLFHPLAMANVLNSTLSLSEKVDVYQRDDLFFSWDSASKIYAFSDDKLSEKVISIRGNLRQSIVDTKILILTFGSAFQYVNDEVGVVGNCHKAPQSMFNKNLTSVEEMLLVREALINDIKAINPKVKILLTVSPVRHIKDGLVENNRSKSRLIELAHQLVDTFEMVHYFPSYEILIDELRDYRFYANDLVHPNQQAVDFIWEQFKLSTMDEELISLVNKVEKLKNSFNHRSLHPESVATKSFLKKIETQKQELIKLNQSINW